jgi:hypothetical protein
MRLCKGLTICSFFDLLDLYILEDYNKLLLNPKKGQHIFFPIGFKLTFFKSVGQGNPNLQEKVKTKTVHFENRARRRDKSVFSFETCTWKFLVKGDYKEQKVRLLKWSLKKDKKKTFSDRLKVLS